MISMILGEELEDIIFGDCSYLVTWYYLTHGNTQGI
jgi:hypothetical protein